MGSHCLQQLCLHMFLSLGLSITFCWFIYLSSETVIAISYCILSKHISDMVAKACIKHAWSIFFTRTMQSSWKPFVSFVFFKRMLLCELTFFPRTGAELWEDQAIQFYNRQICSADAAHFLLSRKACKQTDRFLLDCVWHLFTPVCLGPAQRRHTVLPGL